MGPIVPDEPVTFRVPHLNRSQEITHEAVIGGIFDGFIRDNFRREVVSNVMCGYRVGRCGHPCKIW